MFFVFPFGLPFLPLLRTSSTFIFILPTGTWYLLVFCNETAHVQAEVKVTNLIKVPSLLFFDKSTLAVIYSYPSLISFLMFFFFLYSSLPVLVIFFPLGSSFLILHTFVDFDRLNCEGIANHSLVLHFFRSVQSAQCGNTECLIKIGTVAILRIFIPLK